MQGTARAPLLRSLWHEMTAGACGGVQQSAQENEAIRAAEQQKATQLEEAFEKLIKLAKVSACDGTLREACRVAD